MLSVSHLPSFITVGSGRRGVGGGAGRPPGGQQFLSSESGLQSLKAMKFISADSGKPSLGKDIPTEQLLLNTLKACVYPVRASYLQSNTISHESLRYTYT